MRCGTSFKASCRAWYCARIRLALYTYAGVPTRSAMPRSSAGSKPSAAAPTVRRIEVAMGSAASREQCQYQGWTGTKYICALDGILLRALVPEALGPGPRDRCYTRRSRAPSDPPRPASRAATARPRLRSGSLRRAARIPGAPRRGPRRLPRPAHHRGSADGAHRNVATLGSRRHAEPAARSELRGGTAAGQLWVLRPGGRERRGPTGDPESRAAEGTSPHRRGHRNPYLCRLPTA